MKKLKNIYFVLGRSGVGKDTIVNHLCKEYGLSKLLSYTTRAQRPSEMFTHTFVSEDEMDAIMECEQVVAFTEFDGMRYCATLSQLLDSDFYIIDPSGVEFFRSYIKDGGLPDGIQAYFIGIEASAEECQKRMADRGNNKNDILRRTTHDFNVFAGLRDKVDVVFYNDDFESCIEQIWEFIQTAERGSQL